MWIFSYPLFVFVGLFISWIINIHHKWYLIILAVTAMIFAIAWIISHITKNKKYIISVLYGQLITWWLFYLNIIIKQIQIVISFLNRTNTAITQEYQRNLYPFRLIFPWQLWSDFPPFSSLWPFIIYLILVTIIGSIIAHKYNKNSLKMKKYIILLALLLYIIIVSIGFLSLQYD